jgi:hypothetical protein
MKGAEGLFVLCILWHDMGLMLTVRNRLFLGAHGPPLSRESLEYRYGDLVPRTQSLDGGDTNSLERVMRSIDTIVIAVVVRVMSMIESTNRDCRL